MSAILLCMRSTVGVQDIPPLSHTSGTDYSRNALLTATPFLHRDLLLADSRSLFTPLTQSHVTCNGCGTQTRTQLPFYVDAPYRYTYNLLSQWKGTTTDQDSGC